MPPGARVTDLIDAAGGLADDAEGDRLNLAASVVDGARVYVPHIGELAPPTPVEAEADPDGGLVGDRIGGGERGCDNHEGEREQVRLHATTPQHAACHARGRDLAAVHAAARACACQFVTD